MANGGGCRLAVRPVSCRAARRRADSGVRTAVSHRKIQGEARTRGARAIEPCEMPRRRAWDSPGFLDANRANLSANPIEGRTHRRGHNQRDGTLGCSTIIQDFAPAARARECPRLDSLPSRNSRPTSSGADRGDGACRLWMLSPRDLRMRGATADIQSRLGDQSRLAFLGIQATCRDSAEACSRMATTHSRECLREVVSCTNH